jgi:tRNA(fMet)-specific endonuclease VapC
VTLRYLLDTNIASDAINEPKGAVAKQIRNVGRGTVAINQIVSGELRYGLYRNRTDNLSARVFGFLERISILPIDADSDDQYGRIRAMLERKGTPIGANDMWIAAQVLSLDLTLVTDNVAEFSRVDGLKIENWLRD